MDYEIVESQALARPFLGMSYQALALPDFHTVIPQTLDRLWTYLRERKVNSTGHNLALYLSTSGAPPDLIFDAQFGVEVHEVVQPQGDMVLSETPAGRVVSTVHWGDYAGLPNAHMALHAWCDANGRERAGPNWEIYGDWSDDPTKVRTDVFYLLT
jgi:effector-binding domain-containing protein